MNMSSRAEKIVVKMMMELFIISNLYNILATSQQHPNISDVDRLIKDKSEDYNVFLRPNNNQSEPVEIYIAFELVAIRDFDEVKERFSVAGVLYMAWKDERMAWDPNKYGNLLTFITEHRDFWIPTLILVNAFDKFEKVGHDSFWPIRYIYGGDVLFQPGQVFTVTCAVNVDMYPFDMQTCQLLYSVWGHYATEMKLRSIAYSDKVWLTFYGSNGEWDLIDTHAGLVTENIFAFEFVIKRKPLFIVVNTLIPIIFMSFLNILAFLIPIDSGERLSYNITVLLAVAVFMTIIADSLPQSAKSIAVLCYYLVSIIALSILIIIGSILNMRIHHRDNNIKVSGFWNAFLKLVRCHRCHKKKHPRYEKQNRYITPLNSDFTLQRDNIERSVPALVSKIMLEQHSLYMDTIKSERDKKDKDGRLDETRVDCQEEDPGQREDKHTYTWKDVSGTLDILFFSLSLLALTSLTISFFIYTMT